jgi:pyridoxal phosphate enzyme (YggS family)
MIQDNIIKVRERIAQACFRGGRNADAVRLVVISKNRSLNEIKEVINLGLLDIGENRLQEAKPKFSELRVQYTGLRTHMVGHLQTNKVKEAVRLFDLIQSVDSLRLALEINQQAAKIGKVQDILVEIKTSFETTKFGVRPEEAIELIDQIAQLKNIRFKGLMTIAPILKQPDEARPYFRTTRELYDKINEQRITSNEQLFLSMGMTDDFEVAIEEGSNMIRLGRAVFG